MMENIHKQIASIAKELDALSRKLDKMMKTMEKKGERRITNKKSSKRKKADSDRGNSVETADMPTQAPAMTE